MTIPVKPIRTAREFDRAVAELDALGNADPKEGTADCDRMELLTILIAAYEDEHLEPFNAPSQREILRFMAEQKAARK